MQKNLFSTLGVALVLFIAVACKDNPKLQNAANIAQKDTAKMLEKVSADLAAKKNMATAAAMKGVWRSTIDPRSSIEFEDSTGGKKMIYTMKYDGESVETGVWNLPMDCKDCDSMDTPGCFQFMSDDATDCASLEILEADKLAYYVAGTTNKIQSFKREKKK